MNRRLYRVNEEIEKTEGKIAGLQEYLQTLNVRRKQMEDAEIVRTVRTMKLEGRELLAFLAALQEGTVILPDPGGEGVPEKGEQAETVSDEGAASGEPVRNECQAAGEPAPEREGDDEKD